MFTTVSTVTERADSAGTRVSARLAIQATPLPRKRVRKRLLNLELDRRRRDALSRDFATRVTEHSRWLPPADLALVNWVYRSARPLTELAATGIAPRWVLHRRLNRIVARVLSPTYRHVAMRLSLVKNPPEWPPTPGPRTEDIFQLTVARAIFIHGQTVREVARELDVSRQRITRLRDIIALQAEALAGVS